MHAQTIKGNIYGGGNLAQVEGSTTINIKSGEITSKTEGDDKGNIYGGGYGTSAVLTGNTTINVTGGIISKDVYGGGALANVTGSTEVNIKGGTVTQDVYGGGALANVVKDLEHELLGNTTVNLTGGTIRNSYGGGLGSNEVAAIVEGDATINLGTMVDDGEGNSTPFGDATVGNIFGANNVKGAPQGLVTVTTTSGTVLYNVYGGGNQAAASVSPIVNINGGNITENVYGGGYGATAVITGSPIVTVTDGIITKDVYGGGSLANTDGSTSVTVSGGIVRNDVYGGGALANVTGNTTVSLTGGTIRDSYGGGLGRLASDEEVAIEAIINGNTTVQLGSNDGTTSSKVNGSVFGANNINGTPKGHVKVHVTKTTKRDDQPDFDPENPDNSNSYDVAAVYGGGNLAAYVPSDATLADDNNNFAEVLIENCNNSIAYVYGGGNAAPVPATKVTIKGANAIDNAFAGGNGAGQSTDPSAANYNPGADIGYLEYTRNDPEKEYGTGVATIEIMGGTIHHVYGGSNTLGYIKDHAVVNVEADRTCRMDVTELYGGGKMAPGKAATINISCTGEGKIDNVYGGAHMADLVGDITLNIYGGKITNVFGGNNASGNINGTITVNVDWDDDCTGNSLGNVFGGGDLAQYYAYGYTVDGDTWTPNAANETVLGPTVNIKNGTVTNNVYGGGKGDATDHTKGQVTGNPVVTIGVADNGKQAIVNGDVYGGGSQAAVEGSTYVNITSGGTTPSKKVEIKKDVFGGGSQAAVTYHTNVYINGSTVDGYVYGGGSQGTVGTTGRDADKQDYTKVIVEQSEVGQDVFGGGLGAQVTGNTAVWIKGIDCFIHGSVLGGGFGGDVTGNTHVQIGARDVNGDGEDDDLYPESLLRGGN